MEKAYDRVDRRKLFEVMRGYGVQEILVDVIERIYNGSMIKFEMESIMTGWCESDSGVRQGCPLSPILFNIYMRELGMKISACKQGFKYMVVNNDGVIENKSQAGFLYADNDVCLMAVPFEGVLVEAYTGTRRKHNMKFRPIGHTTSQYGQSFFPKTISAWNGLAFAEAPSLPVFRSNFLNN